jgi:hypothetical protein
MKFRIWLGSDGLQIQFLVSRTALWYSMKPII